MSRAPTWPKVVQRVAADCTSRGFDLVHPLRVDWFNATASASERLPDLNCERALAVLVGNSRVLWPRFIAALSADRSLLGEENPLDSYSERSIGAAFESLGRRVDIRWAHRRPFIPIQRIAASAGLAQLAPARMSVHPIFGPWIGLRAVAIVDVEGPDEALPVTPCDTCAHGCAPALERALAGDDWRLWVAVRDACPIGARYRYPDDQILYHYTKDVAVLRAAVGE